MSQSSFESVLNEVRKLPLEEQAQLVEQLLEEIQLSGRVKAKVSRDIDLVEKTFGTIKGIDRETLISIAEDEEFCGY